MLRFSHGIRIVTAFLFLLALGSSAASTTAECCSWILKTGGGVPPDRSAVYFVAVDDDGARQTDIASFPSAPHISLLSYRGTDFHVRMSSQYRLIALPATMTSSTSLRSFATHRDSDDGDLRKYYCRIPQPLSQEEYRALLWRNVLHDYPLAQRAQSGIHEVLLSLDCFVGDGDSSYRHPPRMYRYCPHGTFTLLPHDDRPDDLVDEVVSDTNEEEIMPHSSREILLGAYDGAASPQWNVELEQWELALLRGGPCESAAPTQSLYATKLVFRCQPPHPSGKTIWLVAHEEGSCEYTIEMETRAVCEWHTAISDTYKCPIPCLSLD